MKFMRNTLLVLFILFLVGQAGAGDIYVSHAGWDGKGNGTLNNPYRSIQKAFDVASAGDTIYIKSDTSGQQGSTWTFLPIITNTDGTYVSLTKRVTATNYQGWTNNALVGKCAYIVGSSFDKYAYRITGNGVSSFDIDATDIAGRSSATTTAVTFWIGDQNDMVTLSKPSLVLTSPWITITSYDTTNPTVLDYSGIASGHSAIKVDCNAVTIKNITFQDAIDPTTNPYAITADTSSRYGLQVFDCTFTNVTTAVHAQYQDFLQVVGNTILNNNTAAHAAAIVTGGKQGYIAYNKIVGNNIQAGTSGKVGILSYSTTGTTIEYNVISNICIKTAAISILSIHGGIASYGSGTIIKNNTITGCHVENDTPNYAIYSGGILALQGTLSNAFISCIYNNIVTDCSYGINIVSGEATVGNIGYNDVYGCALAAYSGISAAATDISANPQFKDTTTYALSDSSAAIGAGMPYLSGDKPFIGAVPPKAHGMMRGRTVLGQWYKAN